MMAKREFYRYKSQNLRLSPTPSPKKKEKSRRRLSLVKLFKVGLISLGIFFILIIGIFAYYAKDLPDPKKVLGDRLVESTKIYDRSEEVLLYEIYEEEKRTVVPLDKISPYVRDAIIAIEDKDFYHHSGIDPRGILRSVWVALKTGGKRLEGASTITQQFIRNSLLTQKRIFSRKIKEIILSIELERKYSKDEILAFYLNQISYGSNAYGIEAAARTYFAKSAQDVSLAEAAILAALPKAPTRLSPYGNNPDLLRQRQVLVLKRMEDLNFITAEQRQEALAEEIVYQKQRTGIKAPHFVMYIKEQLEDKYGKEMVEKGGLKVVTTLDWSLQEQAEDIVVRYAEVNEKNYNAKNAALIALDPRTGEILTMVGSCDYYDLDNDGNVNVTLRDRQPGSAFKPFAYAAAFLKGYTPETLLYDVKTEFNPYCVYSAVQGRDRFGLDCYHPSNYDLRERGPITMKNSLAQSLNIPSVKTLYLAGVEQTIDLAQKMGITSLQDRSRFGLALVLGGGEVKLLDITSAFGVFGQEGWRAEPYSIIRVEDNQGNILEEHQKEKPQQVLDSNVCRMINDILADNQARAPMFGANSYLYLGEGIAAAAKTGTTQEYRDGWTIGYTPNLAVGVWTGNNDNTSMSRTAGVRTAGPIWQEFMILATKDREKPSFKAPTLIEPNKPVLAGQIGGEKVKIDKISGKRATELTPPSLVEERIFRQAHTILYYVDKDSPQGPPPADPNIDPQFKNWEEAVKAWARDPARGNWVDEVPPDEYDDIHTLANQPTLQILSPASGAVISGKTTIKADIQAIFAIKQIDFFIDGEFLGSRISVPYEWTFDVSNYESGRHKLTAKAYDIYLNSGEKSINTIFSSSAGADNTGTPITPKISLTSSEKIEFPLNLKLFLQGKFRELKLYYSDSQTLTNSYLITKEWEKLSESEYQFFWHNNPGVGNYWLYVIGEDEAENVVMSNRLQISISQ